MGSVALHLPETKPLNYTLGRPTLYRPEYCQMIVEFFESAPVSVQPISDPEDSEAKRGAREVCATIPTFQRFAASIGTSPKVLLDWCRNQPDFREAYARAKAAQENFFTQGLSKGIMNPTGAIFVAKNILGWKDKTEVETVSSADTQDMAGMRQALASATPEQLAQFSALLGQMQAQAKIAPAEGAE